MWSTIDRTRRRLLGARPWAGGPRRGSAIERPAASTIDADGQPAVGLADAEDLVLAIGRAEVLRLAGALQALLGPGIERPDTPARLEAALSLAVARLGGGDQPRVTRRPPGLYTPEAWQVHLTAVKPAVSEAIRGAIRTGGFA